MVHPTHDSSSRGPVRLLAACMVVASLLAGRAAPAQEIPAVAERMNVHEVELVLEAPPVKKGIGDVRAKDLQAAGPGVGARASVPALHGLADLAPEDLLLLEDGKPRPVLRLEPLGPGGANPWRLVVYFDLLLARPATVSAAALALAAQAEPLIALGTVDVVVADPEPHPLLAQSRDATALREILAGVAAKAFRDPASRPLSTWPQPPPAALRRQCDRLLTSLAEDSPTGPRALFLVADPPVLSASQLHFLSTVSIPGPAAGGTDGQRAAPVPGAPAPSGDDPAVILGDTARLLAAYGWLTVALPVHRLTGSREPLPEDDATRFRRESWDDPKAPQGVSFLPLIVLLVQWLRGTKPPPAPDLRLVAPQLQMEFASLLELVRPTSGSVITAAGNLAPALTALGSRWHLWYQGDATPAGRERPVALSLLASALDVRTSRWVRSGTPEDLAAARLRRALAGDVLPGSMAVSAGLLATLSTAPGLPAVASPLPEPPEGTPPAAAPAAPAGTAAGNPVILLAQAAASGAAGANGTGASGPWRVSFAWTDAAGNALVTHRLLGAADADLWTRERRLRLPVPPPAAGRPKVAVLLEDLASELWGAAVVDLPAPAAPPSPHPT